MDLGLVYGDMISYWQMFLSNSTPEVIFMQRKSTRVKNEDSLNPFRTKCDEKTSILTKVYKVVIEMKG